MNTFLAIGFSSHSIICTDNDIIRFMASMVRLLRKNPTFENLGSTVTLKRKRRRRRKKKVEAPFHLKRIYFHIERIISAFDVHVPEDTPLTSSIHPQINTLIDISITFFASNSSFSSAYSIFPCANEKFNLIEDLHFVLESSLLNEKWCYEYSAR